LQHPGCLIEFIGNAAFQFSELRISQNLSKGNLEVSISVLGRFQSIDINSHCKEQSLQRKLDAKKT